MGACHYPFISLSCSPNEAIVSPGGVLELSLIAGNELTEGSFPVNVQIVARLETGNEYPLFGPFPVSGVSIPAQAALDGVVRLPVPGWVPEGFQCVVKSVLSRSDTGEYVDMDRCDVEASF